MKLMLNEKAKYKMEPLNNPSLSYNKRLPQSLSETDFYNDGPLIDRTNNWKAEKYYPIANKHSIFKKKLQKLNEVPKITEYPKDDVLVLKLSLKGNKESLPEIRKTVNKNTMNLNRRLREDSVTKEIIEVTKERHKKLEAIFRSYWMFPNISQTGILYSKRMRESEKRLNKFIINMEKLKGMKVK